MKATMTRALYWAPRILGILFALFLSVFAFDVFAEGYGVLGTVVAFVMHLVPTFVVLLVLAIAWRRERLGALLFCCLAVFYVVITRGRFVLAAYLVVSGSLLVDALLFLLSWRVRNAARFRTGEV